MTQRYLYATSREQADNLNRAMANLCGVRQEIRTIKPTGRGKRTYEIPIHVTIGDDEARAIGRLIGGTNVDGSYMTPWAWSSVTAGYVAKYCESYYRVYGRRL